jgi:hypothetical protein
MAEDPLVRARLNQVLDRIERQFGPGDQPTAEEVAFVPKSVQVEYIVKYLKQFSKRATTDEIAQVVAIMEQVQRRHQY